MLAALAHHCLPSEETIDLINVAFEQNSVSSDGDSKVFDVPDRVTGVIAFQELKQAYPNRSFNFVEVNVTKDQLVKERNEHIKALLYPLNTVLDDSIGCAVWFAARGRGILRNSEADNITKLEEYCSPCRVLLLGMGADEQLGGYSRHRERFRTSGFEGLLNEIRLGELEVMQI